MISRAVTRPCIAAAAPVLRARGGVAAFHASAAPQATLRELEHRVKSVRNIEKITKSMKMIAATKLARAQRAMDSAVKFGEASEEVFKQSGAESPEDGKVLFVVVSSDKGLCGGIHTSVSRRTRTELTELHNVYGGQLPAIVVLGEKSKAQLGRAVPESMRLSFNQIGKDIPSYEDALAITTTILNSGVEFDKVNIVYNKFVSSISFESTIMPVFSEKALMQAPNIGQYEMEEDVAKDLAEFSLANAVFATLVEGHASEINSKRNAMDNASKNAGEMITSLNLLYNRGRQAAITGELIDIITGALAV
ncbi:atp3 gamma subunit of the F1 sector of mitochondrial F1F0 ATP synthase [Malassezia sp. CBS 17886]|nr:atp3 gamma subunit of the F1 sector of mitochondrial F1F0 ATP synthase [Malassezia sp. CBS 17886]